MSEGLRAPDTLAETKAQYGATLYELRNPVYSELGAFQKDRDSLLAADAASPIQSPEVFGELLHQEKDRLSSVLHDIVNKVGAALDKSQYFESFIQYSDQYNWDVACSVLKHEKQGAKAAVDYVEKYVTDTQSKQAMRLALDRMLWQRALRSSGPVGNLGDVQLTLRYASSKEARDTMQLGLDANAWDTVAFSHGNTGVDIADALRNVASPQVRAAMRVGIDADLWHGLYESKWGDQGNGSVNRATMNSTSSRKIRRVFSRLLDGGASEPGANDGTYELYPSAVAVEALSHAHAMREER